MSITTSERNKAVTELLNGTLISLKTVVPIDYQTMKPRLIEQDFQLSFGVLIGITGSIKGKLVLTGKPDTFGSIGETMFGMPLEGEMLLSFSGELGNMVAGGLSTNMAEKGTNINITSPTIMYGDTTLSGYKQGLEVTVVFKNTKEINIYLLLD